MKAQGAYCSTLPAFDVTEASNIITEAVDPDANIIFGAVIDEKLDDEIRVTVIATGFNGKNPALYPEKTGQSAIKAPGWNTSRRGGATEVKANPPKQQAVADTPAKEELPHGSMIDFIKRCGSEKLPLCYICY